MAHDKVYGFCESKCKVEVPTKKEFDTLKTSDAGYYSANNLTKQIGTWYEYDTNDSTWKEKPLYRRVVLGKRIRNYRQQVSQSELINFYYFADGDEYDTPSSYFRSSKNFTFIECKIICADGNILRKGIQISQIDSNSYYTFDTSGIDDTSNIKYCILEFF